MQGKLCFSAAAVDALNACSLTIQAAGSIGNAKAEPTVPITGFTMHLHEPFPHYIRENVETDLIM